MKEKIYFLLIATILVSSSLRAQNCQADFQYWTSGLTAQFMDSSFSSTGNHTYSWSFGDGGTSTMSNPGHTYNQAGTYSVSLMIQDSLCFDSIVKLVTVTNPNNCIADFSFTSTQNGVFIFQSLSSPMNSLYHTWLFGDGGFDTSNTINPSHTYSLPGTYRVLLSVRDLNSQCRDTISKVITVLPPPCQAGFTYQLNQSQVQFINTASNYTELVYSFGDGDSSSLPNPIHTYAQSGSYIVCQKVTDSLTNCTATFCDTIQVVLPQPCMAGFTYSIMGDSILFQSTASNYTRLTYFFGDGDSSNLDNPIHIYPSSNQYTVTQIVYNDSTNCTDTIVKTLWATNSGTCVARYQIAIDTTIKSTLFLINQSTNQTTHRYDWDFGDGTVGTGRIPTHQYTDNIAYKICLTVSDSNLNCISTYCDSVGLDTKGNILKSRGFFLKVLNGGSIGIAEKNLDQLISVYPNPFQTALAIKSSQSGPLNYQLFGIDGTEYRSGKISSETIQLSLLDLSKGMYFLRLTNGKQFVTKKIIKQ